MRFVRAQLSKVAPANELVVEKDGQKVMIAGSVICRQRPDTAFGVVFVLSKMNPASPPSSMHVILRRVDVRHRGGERQPYPGGTSTRNFPGSSGRSFHDYLTGLAYGKRCQPAAGRHSIVAAVFICSFSDISHF
jgi:hypothetical protein